MTETELKSQFQTIENNLNGAYETNDAERISTLLAEDWMILEPSTGLSDKEHFLAAIKNGNLVHLSMKKQVVQVKLYNDFAIVISRGKNEGHYLDNPFGSEQWVTNVYLKVNEQWICVLTQEAAVSCE